MATLASMGAMMQCTMGLAPSSLVVLPANGVFESLPIANIMDFKPFVNVPPFGMCTSLANPTVASATAAALGVLTPMPCTPSLVAPWVPGVVNVLIGNMPALDMSSKCMCAFGGVISILSPGQFVAQA